MTNENEQPQPQPTYTGDHSTPKGEIKPEEFPAINPNNIELWFIQLDH